MKITLRRGKRGLAWFLIVGAVDLIAAGTLLLWALAH
jgi:hypothetical protein